MKHRATISVIGMLATAAIGTVSGYQWARGTASPSIQVPAPPVAVIQRPIVLTPMARRSRTTLKDVAQDWRIRGDLDCRVLVK